jgi:glycolate oxidase FAD binding subunit
MDPPPAATPRFDEAIRELLASGAVRPALAADSVEGLTPEWIVEPADQARLAQILADANRAGLKVVPRGGGTKLGWGSPPVGADLVLATRRLDRVLEHAAADMTATVESGCTVAALQETLAKQGQRLATDPLWPDRATVGGILATNDGGMLRAGFGSLRDLIIGITVALPDGTLAKSGGKVVKNVAGYDLPKLFTGSLGTLGVITRATFRLHPLPHAVQLLEFATPDESTLAKLLATLAECALLVAGAQVLASAAEGPSANVQVRVEGLTQAIESKVDRVQRAAAPAGARQVPVTVEPLAARESLFETAGPAAVCKIGVLPARVAGLYDPLRRAGGRIGFDWRSVVQIGGVGLLRLECPEETTLPAAIGAAREVVTGLGGTLVVLQCPTGVKRNVDVWGPPGDALPLMRRVKERFDPAGTLNPGRFVGGI